MTFWIVCACVLAVICVALLFGIALEDMDQRYRGIDHD